MAKLILPIFSLLVFSSRYINGLYISPPTHISNPTGSYQAIIAQEERIDKCLGEAKHVLAQHEKADKEKTEEYRGLYIECLNLIEKAITCVRKMGEERSIACKAKDFQLDVMRKCLDDCASRRAVLENEISKALSDKHHPLISHDTETLSKDNNKENKKKELIEHKKEEHMKEEPLNHKMKTPVERKNENPSDNKKEEPEEQKKKSEGKEKLKKLEAEKFKKEEAKELEKEKFEPEKTKSHNSEHREFKSLTPEGLSDASLAELTTLVHSEYPHIFPKTDDYHYESHAPQENFHKISNNKGIQHSETSHHEPGIHKEMPQQESAGRDPHHQVIDDESRIKRSIFPRYRWC